MSTDPRVSPSRSELEDSPLHAELSRRWTLLPLLTFAGLAAWFKIRSFDVFWHLAAGRWILEHRRLPELDPLRFTAEGHRWVDHEWLFQVGLATVEQVGGLTALSLLRIVAVLALAHLFWLAARQLGAPSLAAALLGGAAVFIARPRFFLRPELMTLVILSFFLLQLFRWRANPTRGRTLLLVLLVVFWANAHPAVLMAPFVAFAFLGGSRLSESELELPWGQVAGLSASLGVATLLTPAGLDLWRVPGAIAGALEDLPGTNPEWLPIWKQPLIGYWVLIVALLAVTWLTWRKTSRIDLGTAAVALALATLGATSVRQLAPFAVGATLHLARCCALLDLPPIARPRIRRWIGWSAAALAMAYLVMPPTEGPLRPRQGHYPLGFGLLPQRFPEAATDFVEQHPEIGHLYNNVAFGGYLLWQLYPPRQVFNDGRNEVNPTFLSELAAARSDGRLWQELLDRYELAGALVRYDPRRRPVVNAVRSSAGSDGQSEAQSEAEGPPKLDSRDVVWLTSNEVLFGRDQFALVHWDDVAMVLLERRPEHRALIEAYEYRFVRPEDLQATVNDAGDPERRIAILKELQRKLLEDPGSQRATALINALQGGGG